MLTTVYGSVNRGSRPGARHLMRARQTARTVRQLRAAEYFARHGVEGGDDPGSASPPRELLSARGGVGDHELSAFHTVAYTWSPGCTGTPDSSTVVPIIFRHSSAAQYIAFGANVSSSSSRWRTASCASAASHGCGARRPRGVRGALPARAPERFLGARATPSGRRRSVARQVLGDANARAATSGCWLSQPTLPATQVREPSCVRTIGSTGGDGGSAAVASLPDGRRIERRWTIPGAAGGGYD